MSPSSFVEEIVELNMSYLLLAQRLIQEDKAGAMVRLGIGEEMADLLDSLSVSQLTKLARTNQLLCHLTTVSAEQLAQVTRNPRDQGMGSLHAALLMAGDRKRA